MLAGRASSQSSIFWARNDLAQASRHHHHVLDGGDVELRLQARQHVVGHQALHFEGHAGHAHEDGALVQKPHAGGRAHGVVQHLAVGRHQGLLAVHVQHGPLEALEYFLDVVQRGLVHHQLGAEVAGQDVLGEVVLGGAEAAGDEHHLRPLPGQVQGRHNLIGPVRYRRNLPHPQANFAQLLAHKGRIGIDDLPV